MGGWIPSWSWQTAQNMVKNLRDAQRTTPAALLALTDWAERQYQYHKPLSRVCQGMLYPAALSVSAKTGRNDFCFIVYLPSF